MYACIKWFCAEFLFMVFPDFILVNFVGKIAGCNVMLLNYTIIMH